MSMRPSHVALLLSCIAVVATSGDAAAETCDCRDVSFDWHGCDAVSCDPGAWAGCTPSHDDSFAVRDGCHVHVDAGDDVLLEQAAPNRFVVQSGGSVTVRGPVEWRVGPGGFLAMPGSRVELSGGFRSFGEDAYSEAVGANERFPIGDVRPCRDFECSDDAELVRIAYPSAVYGDWSPFLARLDPARDALCFWQASEDGAIGADAGFCYRIVAVAAEGAEPHLDFDVRQVWRAQSDQAGYPLARRVVQQGSLLGDHAAGAREIRLRETDVVVGRVDQMGRFVRCGDRQIAHLIASVRDEPGGDVLVLADDRGLDLPFPDRTRCHVDWGWGAGDFAFAMAPVHVTSATNLANQVHVRLEGAASLRSVVFDGLGGSGGSGRGAVQIDGGPLERFEHVWITDPLVRDREALFLDDLPCDAATVRHLTITGGPVEASFDKNYGLLWFGGATCTYRLEHYYPRHRADDNFVLESTGSDPVGGIVMRWVHAGPSAVPGDSGQLFDLGVSNQSSIDAQDVLCTACTTQDGVGSLILPSFTGGVVSRALWVGAFNGGAVANQAGASTIRFIDFGLVGAAVDGANAQGYGPLLGHDAERFYVRDYVDPRSQSSQLCTLGPVATRRLRAGVFLRVATGREPCSLTGDAALEDVYFVDVGRTRAAGSLLGVTSGATDVALTRLTMAFTTPPVKLARGIDVASGAGLFLDGPLLTGFRGAGVESAMRLGSPEQASLTGWGAPTCFWDDDVDDDEASIAAYGTPPLRGVDPIFRAPAAARFDLDPASPARAAGCGAKPAGIRTSNWAHRKAKLVPVHMGPKPRPCGISGVEVLLGSACLAIVRRASRRCA